MKFYTYELETKDERLGEVTKSLAEAEEKLDEAQR